MELRARGVRLTSVPTVSVAPRNVSISVSPSSTLEEGHSVNMTCSSDGLPAPKIRWSRQLHDGSLRFLSENTTLTLTSTRRGDSGTYVCEASNQAGTSRKEAELLIQGGQTVINEFIAGIILVVLLALYKVLFLNIYIFIF